MTKFTKAETKCLDKGFITQSTSEIIFTVYLILLFSTDKIYAYFCKIKGLVMPHKISAIIIAILFACSSAIADEHEESPYLILVGEAEKAIADKDYKSAAERLKEAMAVEPANPSNILLMSNLGMVYGYMDEDSLALATLDEALQRAPHMTAVRNNRGRLLLKMGLDVDAFDDFAMVIDADSLNTTARYYHGIIALYAGKLPLAEADFDVLRSVSPDGYDTAVALSSLYSLTRRDREAIPYLERLIKADPAPEFYAGLAGCHLALGQLSEASEIIAEGLKRYSYDPELYYYRAWLNRDRYRLDEARSDSEQAIRLGASPEKVRALFDESNGF